MNHPSNPKPNFNLKPTDVPIIYIDGFCLLCEHATNFIYKRSTPGSFYFALLQDHPDIAEQVTEKKTLSVKPSLKLYSTVVCYQNQIYLSGEAVLFILRRMHFPYSLLGKILGIFPSGWLNFFYGLVARNRFYFFKKKSDCSVPASEVKKYFMK